jgi:nucleotide-binding universal stress UspA family protein
VVHHAPAVVAGWLPVLVGPDRYERDLIEDELMTEVGALRGRHPALEVHAAVHDGAPYMTLAEHAGLVAANVLVVGSSDSGALTRFLHGSTGADLVRKTSQLVVVARDLTPVQQAAMATGYPSIVAVLDDRDTCPQVLRFAADMASRWGTGVRVVRSAPDAGHAAAVARSVPEVVLRGLLGIVRRRYPCVPVRVETVTADLADTVVTLSADASLVVVGDRRHGVVHRLLTVSVGRRVLHNARCTVAAIPCGPFSS